MTKGETLVTICLISLVLISLFVGAGLMFIFSIETTTDNCPRSVEKTLVINNTPDCPKIDCIHKTIIYLKHAEEDRNKLKLNLN